MVMKKNKNTAKTLGWDSIVSVPIAELKSRLSKYLKLVKTGKEVIVTDHKTPVAKVVAFHDLGFDVLSAKRPPLKIRKLASLPATGKTNSLRLLIEERKKR